MKKLLSSLGAIAISGSGVASVAACGDDNGSKITLAQNRAKEIADEITAFTKKTGNNKVYLMANEILKKLDIEQITTEANSDIDAAFFNAAFKSLLSNFDTYDTNHITYTGTLKEGTTNNEITATIKFDTITTTAKFNVAWASEDDYVGNFHAASQLFNNTHIILPNNIDPNLIPKSNTAKAVWVGLIANSDNFSRNVLKKLIEEDFFATPSLEIPNDKVVLKKDTDAKMDINISLKTDPKINKKLPITVRLANTNQEQANTITSLIRLGGTYTIVATIPEDGVDTSIPGPITEAIKKALLKIPILSKDDVDNIEFNGRLTKTDEVQNIELIASIGTGDQEATSSTEISVMVKEI